MFLNSNIIDLVLYYSSIDTMVATNRLDKRIHALLETKGFWRTKLETNSLPFVDLNLELVAQYLSIPFKLLFPIWCNIFREIKEAQHIASGILFVHKVEFLRTGISGTICVSWDKGDATSKLIEPLCTIGEQNRLRINKLGNGWMIGGSIIDVNAVLTACIGCSNLLATSVRINDACNYPYTCPSSIPYRNGIWDAYIML
jgi:hypothetical protein